ncbi:MAG: NUDIX hydrolase [Parcubacteria group bacterium]|nr:NUDIX hydrolase [Parcubacteria group bacterium]
MENYILNLRKKVGSIPLIIVGSTVVVMNKNGGVLLQKRSDSNDWGLPGGAMEPGESFKETARRELFEETNLKCTDLQFLQTFSGKEFYYKYPNGDESYSVIALFKAIKFEGNLKINDNEGLYLKFFSINNFPNLEKRAKTILEKIKL